MTVIPPASSCRSRHCLRQRFVTPLLNSPLCRPPPPPVTSLLHFALLFCSFLRRRWLTRPDKPKRGDLETIYKYIYSVFRVIAISGCVMECHPQWICGKSRGTGRKRRDRLDRTGKDLISSHFLPRLFWLDSR